MFGVATSTFLICLMAGLGPAMAQTAAQRAPDRPAVESRLLHCQCGIMCLCAHSQRWSGPCNIKLLACRAFQVRKSRKSDSSLGHVGRHHDHPHPTRPQGTA